MHERAASGGGRRAIAGFGASRCAGDAETRGKERDRERERELLPAAPSRRAYWQVTVMPAQLPSEFTPLTPPT
jgi:hypothetical protein